MMECRRETSRSDDVNNYESPMCPHCCLSMEERDRYKLNNILYVWYRCRDPCCTGSNLRQYPLTKDGYG